MGTYIGSHSLDDVVPIPVGAHTPATSADVDADSTPTYDVYEGVTDTAILTAQTTTKWDDASTVGFYRGSLTLSAGSGFEDGKFYTVRVHTIVGSVTSSEWHVFQILAPVDAAAISAPVSSAADIAAAVATVLSLVNTTIATLATQLQFTLTTGPPDDEALEGAIITFTDAASSVQRAYGIVKTYTGSSRTVVLVEAPKYAIAVGDTVLASPNPRGVVEAESYAALAAEATAAQLDYMILSLLAERNKASTTLTSRKLDGSTKAMDFTLDDSVNPLDQKRKS